MAVMKRLYTSRQQGRKPPAWATLVDARTHATARTPETPDPGPRRDGEAERRPERQVTMFEDH